MPRAVVVDDIGDDDVGVECVDEPGEIVVGRVHPEDRRTFSDPVPRRDRPHVLGILARVAGGRATGCAFRRTGTCTSASDPCPGGARTGCTVWRTTSRRWSALRLCGEVGLDQSVRCRRVVEVHDRSDAIRPSEVLDEHVLPAAVDARVVLLPEHDDVVVLPGPDRSPALSRDARGQRAGARVPT